MNHRDTEKYNISTRYLFGNQFLVFPEAAFLFGPDREKRAVANFCEGLKARFKAEDSSAGRLEQMLELHRQRAALEAEIEATDREIVEIVYGLYGLTEEEVTEGRD